MSPSSTRSAADTAAAAAPYRPPAWLPGGHLQTIYTAVLAPRPRVAYRRQRWETPDGDFIDLDWVDGPAGAPLVALFHGLEGDSSGHYAQSLMAAVQQRQWRGVVVHFRGCSGTPNRQVRAYHSGDWQEIDWILRRLKAATPDAALYAAGVSLGGNALLKWLGVQQAAATTVLAAAAAISAPVDLSTAGRVMDQGFNKWVYTRRFLRTLKPKVLQKLAQAPGLVDAAAFRKVTTLHAFDDHYTAPVHGFRDAHDYWAKASSKPGLPYIRVPTLLLNARNDPFLPAGALPAATDVSPWVTCDFPATGGHVGFISGPFPGRLTWMPARVLGFFAAHGEAPDALAAGECAQHGASAL